MSLLPLLLLVLVLLLLVPCRSLTHPLNVSCQHILLGVHDLARLLLHSLDHVGVAVAG